MYGKWLVLALVLSAAVVVSCKKVPTASMRRATPPPIAAATPAPVQPLHDDTETLLSRVVGLYEREPTSDRAAAVWEAFSELDTRLAELRLIVSSRAGGARAEAEVRRIELQRARDLEMTRFATTQARIKTANAAFDALAASFDQNGIRAAASVVARGVSNDRFSNSGVHGLRSLRAHLP